ncbi:MAG: hypothetical protein L3J71_07135 [Victivallaceae bacterium]|nr:hypothetical protein [Victivallaceae bacterium]
MEEIFFIGFIFLIIAGLTLLLKTVMKKVGNKNFLLIIIPAIVISCLFFSPLIALFFLMYIFIYIAIVMLLKHPFPLILGLFLYSIISMGFLMPFLCYSPSSKRCASNIEYKLWNALEFYAQDNDGHFPNKDGKDGLDMLRAGKYGLEDRLCYCHGNGKVLYIYHGGLTTSSPADKILIDEPASNHDGVKNVLYCDGKIKLEKDPNYYAFKSSSLIKSLLRLVGWR